MNVTRPSPTDSLDLVSDQDSWQNAPGALFSTPQPGPSTQAVHGGRCSNPYHAVTDSIVQTATYTFTNTADTTT